jgi:hypothetical protein
MKTLDQIESRTPISSVPFAISAPGSYYLTKNLNVTSGDAITITANRVTLDLNGFTISSTASPAAGTGILLSGGGATGNLDITIWNGHISGGVTFSGGTYSGSGFGSGISGSCSNVRVSGVSVSGCQVNGIYLSNPRTTNIVESCMVQTIGNIGIQAAVVSKSAALECGGVGIVGLSIITDCQAIVTGFGAGISTSGTATNCFGVSVDGPGINAGTAINCEGTSTNMQGINALTAAINCHGKSIMSQGIAAPSVSHSNGFSTENRGISAEVVFDSFGDAGGGSFGINASRIANNCSGSSVSGIGLGTNIAIGCAGRSITGTGIVATFKYNMP